MFLAEPNVGLGPKTPEEWRVAADSARSFFALYLRYKNLY